MANPTIKLFNLSHDQLYDLLYYYDAYIQEANDINKYEDGWYPVCISEFYESGEYEEWKNNSENY